MVKDNQWVPHLVVAANVLLHLKSKKILHNDIKLDNFVFGTSCAQRILPILVDFGKACFVQQGKSLRRKRKHTKANTLMYHLILEMDFVNSRFYLMYIRSDTCCTYL